MRLEAIKSLFNLLEVEAIVLYLSRHFVTDPFVTSKYSEEAGSQNRLGSLFITGGKRLEAEAGLPC